MTEDEKKLLQAQHRLEAIEARNRQKERKARTRRLIQMGAAKPRRAHDPKGDTTAHFMGGE